MAAGDRLDRYRSKRDFSKTSEPEGGLPGGSGASTFVVQKHAARALHYDFRIEVDGVMPSWAVPKGPSYDPKVKRLAVHTEDHPLDYQYFEGTIPDAEYGGGEVIVWDNGTYRNITEHAGKQVPAREAIERGHLSVWLDGTKLHGGWSLTRTARPGDRQDAWIMVKRKDEHADPGLDITVTAPRSTRSDREISDVRGAAVPTWTAERATWVPPMLAHLAKAPPGDPAEWVCERKLDGLRAIAVRNGDQVELWSRGHLSFRERFAVIVESLGELPVDNFTLDGEIVAYEGDRTSFGLLQSPGSTARPVYEVFDVLHLLGRDTRSLPLSERHRLLVGLVERTDTLRPVETLDGEPAALLERACRSGWEGLILKRADSRYVSGRSGAWRKLKCDAGQELVIGGWTDPRGSRALLGALLVGYHDGQGRLRYAGKVGTGFDHATLEELHRLLEERAREESAFADAPRMKDAHWVEPELVGNFGFAEWTADGRLRHPRFEGLRPDKSAADVVRESLGLPVPSGAPSPAPAARATGQKRRSR